jgi:amino acid transporter
MGHLRRLLLGERLKTRALHHERLTNAQGLAIFGADSLSSTAYATEEILLALAAVGTAAYAVAIPIAGVIALLILLVAVSYREVIHSYPQGGGVYNVARGNLGELPALVGAASLLIDYVLTTAVSTAAGVAAVTSAVPALFPHRVTIGVVIIALLTWANLRGVRESGRLFTIPTYAFIVAFVLLIGYGVWRFATGTFPMVIGDATATVPTAGLAIGALLVLRAFASGCTAMTGIEATSNGVPAFQKPAPKNAARTLIRMAFLLSAVFIGVTLLAYWGRVVPAHDETVVSQISRALFGTGVLYYIIQAATAFILLLAANTPFNGFPRVASQLAIDDYFPRQFANLGSRLVFTNGVILLAAFAALLLALFQGSVHALIPLYAVGVFLGFSLSQLGMIVHGIRERRKRWWPIAVNAVGFILTTVVLIVVFASKFTHGAWVLIPAVAGLVALMLAIHRHYRAVTRSLALTGSPVPAILPDKTMVLLIARVDRAVIHAVKFAKSFEPAHLRAFHVAFDERGASDIQHQWETHVRGVPLDVVVSEYRDLIGEMLAYLKRIERRWADDTIIVVIPEYIPPKFWQLFLHDQIPFRIRMALEQDPAIHAEILNVPAKLAARLR